MVSTISIDDVPGMLERAGELMRNLPKRQVQAKTAEMYRAMFARLRATGSRPEDMSGKRKTIYLYRCAANFAASEQLSAALSILADGAREVSRHMTEGALYLIAEAMTWLERYSVSSPEEAIEKIAGNRWREHYTAGRYEPAVGMRDKLAGAVGTRLTKDQDIVDQRVQVAVPSSVIWAHVRGTSAYRDGIALWLAFGLRPIEIERGVLVEAVEMDGIKSVRATTRTAKTHGGKFGQPVRYLVAARDNPSIEHLGKLADAAGGSAMLTVPHARTLTTSIWKIGEKLRRRGILAENETIAVYQKRNEILATLAAVSPVAAEIALGHKLRLRKRS